MTAALVPLSAATFPFFARQVQAVSYTHLDVYKRQLLLSGGQSLFLFRLPLIAVAIAYYSETSTISAVSYTHLDVYKRQIQ